MKHSTAMRCKGCGYDLHGLTEHRCPECGLTIDRTASISRGGAFWLTLAIAGWVLIAAVLLEFVEGSAGIMVVVSVLQVVVFCRAMIKYESNGVTMWIAAMLSALYLLASVVLLALLAVFQF